MNYLRAWIIEPARKANGNRLMERPSADWGGTILLTRSHSATPK